MRNIFFASLLFLFAFTACFTNFEEEPVNTIEETPDTPVKDSIQPQADMQYNLSYYVDEHGEIHDIDNSTIAVRGNGDIVFLSKEDPKSSSYNTLVAKSYNKGIRNSEGMMIVKYPVTFSSPSQFSFIRSEAFNVEYAMDEDLNLVWMKFKGRTYYTFYIRSKDVQ